MRTITVRDLQQALAGQDPDSRVLFTSDYGDRSHTAQALPVRGEIDRVTLVRTAYSQSGYAIAEDGEDDGEDRDEYLVIR